MESLDSSPQMLRTIRYMGLVFHQLWLSELCQDNPNYTVFVSKEKNGQWRLTLVARQPKVEIVRELVTIDDGEALRITGLLTTHPDPAAFCDSVVAEGGATENGAVSAERCETIHRAMRGDVHAA